MRLIHGVIASCALALAAAACSGSNEKLVATSTPPPGATAGVTATATQQSQPTSAPVQVQDEAVRFAAPGGSIVTGHLYATAGPDQRLVIFAHGANETQGDWREYARSLVAPGLATLTFDFPGFGESQGSRNLAQADAVLEVALNFARSRGHPLIFIVASDFGGTAAIKVAARQELAGIVALSPPAEVQGLDARPDAGRINEAALVLAASGDSAAVSALNTLLQANSKLGRQVDGTDHGIALLRGGSAPAVRQAIADVVMR